MQQFVRMSTYIQAKGVFKYEYRIIDRSEIQLASPPSIIISTHLDV